MGLDAGAIVSQGRREYRGGMDEAAVKLGTVGRGTTPRGAAGFAPLTEYCYTCATAALTALEPPGRR